MREVCEMPMPNLPMGRVTLLFTDIEGSTRLLQQWGDDYASVLAQCRHLAVEQWLVGVLDMGADT